MRRGEAVGHSCQQVEDLPPAALLRARPVMQRSAVDELGDQVLSALELAYVVHGQDVRMVQRRGRLRLALEAPSRGCISELVGEELDRDRRCSLVSSAR